MKLDKKKELEADLMILLVTGCWGLSYIAMDQCLTEMSTFTLNAFRFVGAFLVAALVGYRQLKGITKETLLYAVLVGVSLAATYICVTFGVLFTTISNAAFLASTMAVFIPILEFVMFRKKPTKKVLVAVGLCIIGVALLTLKEDFSINAANLRGDLMSMGCGVAYAFEVCFTEIAVKKETVNPYQLGLFSLGSCGVIMLVCALLFETVVFPSTTLTWAAVIFLTMFCTALAFVVQPIAQQYTEPTHVGIIMSLEPVFAGIAAFFIAHEVLTGRAYLGAFLMLAAVLFIEIDLDSVLGKSKSVQSK